MTDQRLILVVCTGNLCRSPMAEAFLGDLLRKQGKDAMYMVRSAGTWTHDGLSVSALAVQAMAEKGLDIAGHRSHLVSPQDVEKAALIITMGDEHKEALLAEFPGARDRTFLLSELAGEKHDISDPYGSDSLILYRDCANEIGRLLGIGYSRLVQLLEGPGTGNAKLTPSADAKDAST
jgi:protein-tyrosine-phosphatase